MLIGSLILKDKNKNKIIEIYDYEEDFISENDKDFENKIKKLIKKHKASFVYISVFSNNHMQSNEKLIYNI